MASHEQLTPRSGRVKSARRLATRRFRTDAREFIAEGPQAVREAMQLPGVVLEVFATQPATDHHHELAAVARSHSIAWQVVDEDVVTLLSDTVQPQGLVARCRFVDRSLDDVLAERPRLLVVCADIRDPGNAGTVIRCADAAGAGGVVFTGSSVDPFNPKSVRASVGSVFHVDLVVDPNVAGVVARLKHAGIRVLAADGTADLELPEADRSGLLAGPTAWLMGNEAWGLPESVRALADQVVAVPIYGRAESLNLATAAAVCLYASAQAQRR